MYYILNTVGYITGIMGDITIVYLQTRQNYTVGVAKHFRNPRDADLNDLRPRSLGLGSWTHESTSEWKIDPPNQPKSFSKWTLSQLINDQVPLGSKETNHHWAWPWLFLEHLFFFLTKSWESLTHFNIIKTLNLNIYVSAICLNNYIYIWFNISCSKLNKPSPPAFEPPRLPSKPGGQFWGIHHYRCVSKWPGWKRRVDAEFRWLTLRLIRGIFHELVNGFIASSLKLKKWKLWKYWGYHLDRGVS